MYVWLRPFAVQPKLSQHCLLINYTPIQNKKFKKTKKTDFVFNGKKVTKTIYTNKRKNIYLAMINTTLTIIFFNKLLLLSTTTVWGKQKLRHLRPQGKRGTVSK